VATNDGHIVHLCRLFIVQSFVCVGIQSTYVYIKVYKRAFMVAFFTCNGLLIEDKL